MKIVRFIYKNKEYWGKLESGIIGILKIPPYARIELTGKTTTLERVKLLAPATPTKIILAGLNYKDHALELKMKIPKEPVIFLKPATSLIADKQPIVYPGSVKRLDYEAELALVIRKEAKNINEKEVDEYILGYSCLNDVTARDIQKKDLQWTRAKSFDTFCPFGPWVETEADPANLRIVSYLNGVIKQNSRTSNFIFSARFLVSFISKVMTLMPGDIISTGTPAGVGKMQPDDTIEIEIEAIGRLKNRVAKAGKY